MQFKNEQNQTPTYEGFSKVHQDYYDFMRLQQIIEGDFTPPETEKIKKFRVKYHHNSVYNSPPYPRELYVEFRKPDGRSLTSAENGKLGGRPPKPHPCEDTKHNDACTQSEQEQSDEAIGAAQALLNPTQTLTAISVKK